MAIHRIILFNREKIFLGIILAVTLITSACSMNRDISLTENRFSYQGKSLAVLGFKPAMTMVETPGVVRSPFSGAVFMAEPVPRATADSMSENLFNRLRKSGGYELIPPKMTNGVLSSLISSGDNLQDIDICQKIGLAFSTDAVMAGYLYRWQEREGNEYSVKRPASVAFDLYLIKTLDKLIIWKAKFDKTQQPLSENILDLKFFIKGKGKWMTVSELADLGLETIFSEPIKANK